LAIIGNSWSKTNWWPNFLVMSWFSPGKISDQPIKPFLYFW
jgi:hypothetical protein